VYFASRLTNSVTAALMPDLSCPYCLFRSCRCLVKFKVCVLRQRQLGHNMADQMVAGIPRFKLSSTPCVTFRNVQILYVCLCDPGPTLRLEYRPLSAVSSCWFGTHIAALHIWQHLRTFTTPYRPWFVFSVRCKPRPKKNLRT